MKKIKKTNKIAHIEYVNRSKLIVKSIDDDYIFSVYILPDGTLTTDDTSGDLCTDLLYIELAKDFIKNNTYE